MPSPPVTVHRATPAHAEVVATLLDDFNREFECPTPGVDVLAERLRTLLDGDDTAAFLAGDPATGLALITLRPSVWYVGPVALLDELYVVPPLRSQGIGTELLKAVEAFVRERGGEVVEIDVDGVDHDARRFYERHGYSCIEPGEPEPMFRYYRELTADPAS